MNRWQSVGRQAIFPREVDPLFKTGSLLLCLDEVLSRHCFEQNCLCAYRWRIGPKLPLHVSQRAFVLGIVHLRIVGSRILGPT
jgi:hypothetical protein